MIIIKQMIRAPKLSQRLLNAPSSPIRKLVPYANEAKKRGVKVYHLNIGDPDFLLPRQIKNSLKQLAAITEALPYAPSNGLPEILEGWQKYYQDLKINLNLNEIMVTCGGSEALSLAIAATCDPGEEILVFEPFYANYLGLASLLTVEVVAVELEPQNNYHLPKIGKITAKISPKTKAILLTNPNNPTGTVFEKEELENILAIARKYHLFVIADETYRGLCFEGKKSFSLLEIANEEEKQLIIIIDSLSKRFNICGARIGALISKNEGLMAGLMRFAQTRLSVATLEQKLVVPMLKNCLSYIEGLAKKYQNRRDVFLTTLEKELGIKISRPEGAFYSMIKLPIKNTDDFAKWLLTDFEVNRETVMVAPGSGFYVTPNKGKGEIRVAYVLREKYLVRAANILALGIKQYLKKR